MKKGMATLTLAVIIMFLTIYGPFPAHALIYDKNGWAIGGFLESDLSLHLQSPGEIMKFRNFMTLNMSYTFKDGMAFVRLRPMYDAVFDVTDKGIGGSIALRDKMQHNFGKIDELDPLLREAWIEWSPDMWSIKLGRQIISWGKDDGVTCLNLVNPFNGREMYFESFEDIRIPLWMANISYWFDQDHGLQLLVIPRYVPGWAPPEGPWSYAVSRWAADYNDWQKSEGAVFKMRKPSSSPDNWEWGVRWSGALSSAFRYTLNYFYTWDDSMNTYAKGTWTLAGGAVNTLNIIKPDRITVIGGSFDYSSSFLLKDWVFRGEAAYYRKDTYYDYYFGMKERDHLVTMLGWDKYFFTDWWISFQLWQDTLIQQDGGKYYGGGSYDYGNGMVDRVENTITFYLMKSFLPGDILHTAVLVVYTDEGEGWIQPQARYEVTDKLHVTTGFNIMWGPRDDLYGQWRDKDQVYWEVRYSF